MVDGLADRQTSLHVVAVDFEHCLAEPLGVRPQVVACVAVVGGTALCLMPPNSVAVLDVEVILSRVACNVDNIA